MTAPEPVSVPAAPKKAPSVWEDFIDIFVSPSAVFARREKASFFLPLVVVTVVVAILIIGTKSLVAPALDADIARQVATAMKTNPQITADQMQKARDIGATIGFIMMVVILPIAIIVAGIVLWAVSKFFDSTLELSAGLLIAAYAAFPKILWAVAAALIAAFSDPASLNSMMRLSVGPAHFMNAETTSPILTAIASRLDVFTIWSTVLLAIGLSVIGKISRGKAFAAAAIVWVLGVILPLYGALKAS